MTEQDARVVLGPFISFSCFQLRHVFVAACGSFLVAGSMDCSPVAEHAL